MEIRQGDALTLPLFLCHLEKPLTPESVAEMELCIGATVRRLYSKKELLYDDIEKNWFYRLEQRDTIGLGVGTYAIQVRVKYKSVAGEEDVKTIWLDDKLIVKAGKSKEVI